MPAPANSPKSPSYAPTVMPCSSSAWSPRTARAGVGKLPLVRDLAALAKPDAVVITDQRTPQQSYDRMVTQAAARPACWRRACSTSRAPRPGSPSDPVAMMRWYVAHTQPLAEAKASWHLRNQGFRGLSAPLSEAPSACTANRLGPCPPLPALISS